MKYQLLSRDEYGTGSIIGTFDTCEAAILKGRSLVTESNFSNSLSSAEQIKSVEAYMVDFVEDKESDIYAGTFQNKHMSFKEGSSSSSILETVPVNIYIGSRFVKNKDKKNIESMVFMKDDKGKPINSLTNSALKGKTMYYVKPI